MAETGPVMDGVGLYEPVYDYETSITPVKDSPVLTEFSILQIPRPIREVFRKKTVEEVLLEISYRRTTYILATLPGAAIALIAIIDGGLRLTNIDYTSTDPWSVLPFLGTVMELSAGVALGVERFQSWRRREDRLIQHKNSILERVWSAARPTFHPSAQSSDPTE